MKKLMNILMLSCKKSSELIEKQMYFGLNPVEKMQLFLHTGMCDACRSWKKQSKRMDEVLHRHINGPAEENGIAANTLSDEARQEIIARLDGNK